MSNNNGGQYQHQFFETTGVQDFKLKKPAPPPEGYPAESVPDMYCPEPCANSYDERKKLFFDHVLKNPAPDGIKGYYYELVRLFLEQGPVYEDLVFRALDFIEERRDCADFVLLGIIRMLYQLSGSRLVSSGLLERAEDVVLGFKYWPDEPGIDSMCTWTENHQIMFSCNEYLAGQLYPDRIFGNAGHTGLEKMKRAQERIDTWLSLRYRTGFSEWLSNVYYDEDITALINLIDFCKDRTLARKAEIVLDLMVYDMALNSFHGVFTSTHGRTYTAEKQDALAEATMDTQKLLFGVGRFSGRDNMSAVCLALSPVYRLPEVIRTVALDTTREEMLNRQRMGIRIAEAARWGLSTRNPEDVMILLSLEAYAHPKTFVPVMRLFDRFRWWQNQFFSMFAARRSLISFLKSTGLAGPVARFFEKDMTRNTREEVDIYTYRTPDYMMSSAVDYRPGYGGDQQHIWQVSFGPRAVCFTTHPAKEGDESPGYWVGSGTLPRVAQYKNSLIALYRISRKPGIYLTNRIFFTHAWLPEDRFDEFRERDGWIFARSGKGYLALYSLPGYTRTATGPWAGKEIIAAGVKTAWVCEVGREAVDGSFDDFIEKMVPAWPEWKGGRVFYRSPGNGALSLGLRGPFLRNGGVVDLHPPVRYDNPYGRTGFDEAAIRIECGGGRLTLDLEKGLRERSDR